MSEKYSVLDSALIRPSKGLSNEAVARWQPMVKKPSVVYIKRLDEPFTVLTESGTVTMAAGGYLCHDPVAGRFWPVDKLYLDLHYRTASQEEEVATAADTQAAGHQYAEPPNPVTYGLDAVPSEPPA